MFRKAHTNRGQEGDQGSIYLSISDLMSGLLMIFVLLVLVLVYVRQQTIEKVEERRVVIIQSLQDSLASQGIAAEVNEETGDVSILDSILFDEGQSYLKPAGTRFLDSFIPVYSGVIYSKPVFEEEIVRVVVEGHTSSNGSFDHNMSLSLARADSVLHYIHASMEYPDKERFQTKLIGAGRGEIQADQSIDAPEDRRVVFRLQFKGLQIEELLNQGRAEYQEGT